jgi:DNA polymerase III subunit gamma/tau
VQKQILATDIPEKQHITSANNNISIPVSASEVHHTSPISEQAVKPAPAAAQANMSFDGDWASFSARLPLAGLTRELAMQSELISHEASRFTLRVPKSTLLAAGALERLQSALSAALGRPIKVDTELGAVSNSASLNAAREKSEKQQAAEQTVAGDEFANSLMAKFGGQVVAGSIRPVES